MMTRGIFQETLAKIILILSGFILNLFLARRLGPAEYGVVGIVTSFLFVFEIFLTNGLRQALSKIISSKEVNLRILWKKSFLIQMVLCAFLILIGLLSLNWIVNLLKIEPYKEFLFLFFLIIPIEGIFYINLGFLNGLQKYKQHAFANSFYSLTRVVFSLFFLYILSNGILAVLLGTLLAYTFSIFTSKIRFINDESTDSISIKYLINTTIGTLIFYLLVNIFLNLDILLLRGFGLTKIQIGYYKASASVGIALYFLISSVLQVSYPIISKLFSQKAFADLRKILTTLFLAIFYLTVLAFLFTNIFSKLIITLLFGVEYSLAATVLPWYVASIGLLSIVIMLGNMMIAFDQNKTYLIFLSSTLVSYIALVFLFLPIFNLNAPPISLIIVALLIILILAKIINRNTVNIIESKKILLNVSWFLFLGVISILIYNYYSIYVNPYVIGSLVLLLFGIISILSSKELKRSLGSSVSLLIGGRK